jgi:hypothetical protein
MSAPLPRPDQKALLRAAVEKARAAFEQAKEERDRLLTIREDVEPGNPDHSAASRQAIKAVSHASVVYARALARYSYYLVEGKAPPETGEDGPKDESTGS